MYERLIYTTQYCYTNTHHANALIIKLLCRLINYQILVLPNCMSSYSGVVGEQTQGLVFPVQADAVFEVCHIV